jgi:hypothetical protein
MWTNVRELIPVLQVAIGPVILISGVGLLLLTMTNRFGRITERSRFLCRQLREGREMEPHRAQGQIEILSRRAVLVRRAIFLASVSVLLAAILIIVLFLAALLRLELALVISALFISCMASLIGSLVAFIQDINQSLVALRLELGDSASDKDETDTKQTYNSQPPYQ